jgi:hypothetical protein
MSISLSLCIKIFSTVGALCSLGSAKDHLETVKATIEACAKGGEAALALKETDRQTVQAAFNSMRISLERDYRTFAADERIDYEPLFVSISDVLVRCSPEPETIARLSHNPLRVAEWVADQASQLGYPEFAEGKIGRTTLTHLVTRAFERLRGDAEFMKVMQGPNWVETFRRLDEMNLLMVASDTKLSSISADAANTRKLVARAELRECVRQCAPAIRDIWEIMDAQIEALLETNPRIMHPDDFHSDQLLGIIYGLEVFFLEDERGKADAFKRGATRQSRQNYLASAEINNAFTFDQWSHIDVIYEQLRKFHSIIRDIGNYAKEIGATTDFEVWFESLQERVYAEALDYLQVAKPRVDKVRATWNDLGAQAMQLAVGAGFDPYDLSKD